MPQIEITISEAGDVQVEARGTSGAGCQQLTRAIEEAIGRTTADAKKPEFFQQAQQSAGGIQCTQS